MKKLIFCALFVLTACASAPDENAFSAEELYNLGYERMEKTEWSKAAATFEKVELEHPYSQWATKAKLMGAYAHYKDEKYDDAVLSLDRFIRYHPGNKDIAYAYYMKGLCYYGTFDALQGQLCRFYRSVQYFYRSVYEGCK